VGNILYKTLLDGEIKKPVYMRMIGKNEKSLRL